MVIVTRPKRRVLVSSRLPSQGVSRLQTRSRTCPHCGGRLFLEEDVTRAGHSSFFWDCINCARSVGVNAL